MKRIPYFIALLAAAAASTYGGVAYTTPTRTAFAFDARGAYEVMSRTEPVALPFVGRDIDDSPRSCGRHELLDGDRWRRLGA